MRFHAGPVPEDPEFRPKEEGWRPMREPGPWALQLLALPFAAVFLLLSLALLFLVFPPWALQNTNFRLGWSFGPMLLVLALFIPVHELIHALFHPGWGLTHRTVIGVWLSRILFYAHYEGPMARNRFLLVLAAPYVALSLLPLLAMAVLQWFPAPAGAFWLLAYLSIVAGVTASGDAVGLVLVLLQVPRGAVVRNLGWRTYWRPAAEEVPQPGAAS